MGDFLAVDLVLFVAATFAASFVAGLAGFAFGIVAAAVWLHFLPPAQTAALIVAFGRIVQGVAVWKLRKAIKHARLVPFLIGGAKCRAPDRERLRGSSAGSCGRARSDSIAASANSHRSPACWRDSASCRSHRQKGAAVDRFFGAA